MKAERMLQIAIFGLFAFSAVLMCVLVLTSMMNQRQPFIISVSDPAALSGPGSD
ncbi:MAG TPA: hypothetical protein VGJ20_04425 [Xanthobacteraceae bacterium]|jgi:hypothetical protein